MGVIVKKDEDTNEELTRRINADLRAKMYSSSEDDDDYDDGSGLKRKKDPDFVEDSEYTKDFKKTSRFGWVWVVLIVLAILSIISILMF